MHNTSQPLTIATVFIWIGFVSAISFMEAWLKFQAPGITVQLGVGIGRLVFHALIKVELVCAIVIIASMLYSRPDRLKWDYIFFGIPFLILVVQTLWLLPILDARAELLLQNEYVPPSTYHFYYIFLEIIKVVCLALFGFRLFKSYKITS